jgi:hypothetical protein
VKNLEYCKRQFQLSTLRAQWCLTSVTSGHYKQRKIFHGTDGPEFTDDEKLANAMATAQRHINLAAEFSESLAEAEAESEEP